MEILSTDQTKRQTSGEFSKKLFKLTVAGGVTFWVVDLAMSLSPISAEYLAAFSISSLPMALVEALVGGLIIACFVSYFLLRFSEKLPTKNTILKSVILSFSAIIVIEVLSTFGNPSNAYVYLLVDTVMNIPRILALGIVVGYLYKRLCETEFKPIDNHNSKPIISIPYFFKCNFK
jgi:hypothetical protein